MATDVTMTRCDTCDTARQCCYSAQTPTPSIVTLHSVITEVFCSGFNKMWASGRRNICRGMARYSPLQPLSAFNAWYMPFVATDRVGQALEILEEGKSLLWSEMRSLRTSIDQLREVGGTTRSDKQGLIIASTSSDVSATVETGDGGLRAPSLNGMDSFGRLLSQTRDLLGFETFLKATSFDNLRSDASCGPVIIINHCEWRSDILIRDSPPSLIPTDGNSHRSESKLRDRLIVALDSKKYQRTLSFMLKDLYELIGRPVIERFCILGVPKQSQSMVVFDVSPLLPLHVMGPNLSGDGVRRFFSNLYIPSYTPSLATLIESQKSGMQTSDRPSLLLVAQPGATLPGAWEEVQVVRALSMWLPLRSLISEAATPAAMVEALRLGCHKFVHFAYFRTLKMGNPFDATAEPAFLSACRAAGRTRNSIGDEALYLAAAAQYCGFKSVIGTMWEVANR